jgi:hypothetical protein
MRPIGDLHPPVSSTALVAVAKARASKKTSPANNLHPHTGGDAEPGTRSGKDRRKSTASQPGTQTAVPFRYSSEAPRLDAAFVAQLLGQIIPDRASGLARMLAAYEETPSSAQLFDTAL